MRQSAGTRFFSKRSPSIRAGAPNPPGRSRPRSRAPSCRGTTWLMVMASREPPVPGRSGKFLTTQWSVVHRAGQTTTAESRAALAVLCGQYWYPLYAFIRRQGCGVEEAQDLTQEFFTRVLEKHYLQDADPARGRFRSFLLASVRHFMSNERDRARALKRGGDRPPL